MIDRDAWESVRPITCRGTGMGDALDAWHATDRSLKTFEKYEQFATAKALYNQLDKAITVARKKLSGKKSSAADEAEILLKNAETKLTKFQKEIEKEYGRRISEAQKLINEANEAVDKNQTTLDRELDMFTKMLKSIEQKCKEVENGTLGSEARKGANHLLTSEVEQQQKILTTFGTGLAKAYEAMSDLASKRMSIHGPQNVRQAVDYFDHLEVGDLRTNLEALNTNVGVLQGYIQQLTVLRDRATVVFDKAVKGVPKEVKEELPIAKKLEELTTEHEKQTQAATTKITEWNEMIKTVETYITRANRALKAKSK